MDNKEKTLELGTKPVGNLLFQYAIPAIIAMLASSLYNMVDSIFIGQGVGPMAISGLAITFPFMNLSTAFGAGIGIGAASLLSMKLGQKDYKAARNILGNTVMLNVITGIGFSIISLCFLDPILIFFGASENTIEYAREYMYVILIGNVFTHLYFGLNALLRASGNPKKAMGFTLFTVIFNTILDPIFIWPLGMGIKGAAYATVLSQVIALVWEVKVYMNKLNLVHFERGIYKLRSQIVKNIVSIGISPFAINACACFVVMFINKCLLEYGSDLAVGAYGIAYKIAFIFIMITLGINQGMQPIAGYNYGAQKYDRLMRVTKYAIIFATINMSIGFIVSQVAGYPCARLFTSDPVLIEMSINAMSIIMILYPLDGYQMVITNFFQCIGKAKISAFLSLTRQLLFLTPMLFILPPIFKLNGVWAAMPVADGISAIVSAVVMAIYIKKFKRLHKNLINEKS